MSLLRARVHWLFPFTRFVIRSHDFKLPSLYGPDHDEPPEGKRGDTTCQDLSTESR